MIHFHFKVVPFHGTFRHFLRGYLFVSECPRGEFSGGGGGGPWEGTPLIKFCCLSCSPMETKKISHNYQLRTWNTWVILNSKIRFLRPFLGGWMPTFANWWVVSSYTLGWSYWWSVLYLIWCWRILEMSARRWQLKELFQNQPHLEDSWSISILKLHASVANDQ